MPDSIGIITGEGGAGKTSALEGDPQHDITPGIIEQAAADTAAFVVDPVGTVRENVGMVFREAEQLRLYLVAERKGIESNETGVYHLRPGGRAQLKDMIRVLAVGGEKRKGAVPGWIIVDEAKQVAAPQRQIKDFMWMLDFGRNFNQGIICVGRRPNVLHRNVRQNASWALTYSINDASEVPNGLLKSKKQDREAIERLGAHDLLVLGRLPSDFDDVLSWPNAQTLDNS